MAYEIVRTKSIVATGSYASKQFNFVKLDASGQLANPSAGGRAIGVVQDKPAAGSPGAVCFPGDITKVYCNGSFDAGDYVMTDANGYAVVATSGSQILGQALTAGSAGKLATIIYQPMGAL